MEKHQRGGGEGGGGREKAAAGEPKKAVGWQRSINNLR